MTVHQAKGMQWPVVFLPALLRNRFPAARVGGRNVWHLIPKVGVEGHGRFQGTVEDERRLFYVAMTRSQKFLHMTWAPIPGKNNRYKKASQFWDNVLVSRYVKRYEPDYSGRFRLSPAPRAGISSVLFSFSDVKYFFECPYQFKLRILYGFNAPIHEALGYGKSLHDALAEVHFRALQGDFATGDEVPHLLARHFHTPYAYSALREDLGVAARRVLTDYLEDNAEFLKQVEFSEKTIEIRLADGVSVTGRIDLVRRRDTNEVTIVDLKSSERAQVEHVTEAQLHVYALGYQELTGRRPDYVEIYELDERMRKPRSVDDKFMQDVRGQVAQAADQVRSGTLVPSPHPVKCGACDFRKMCSASMHGMAG